jgi:very-short-patch-repair endonuclease
MKTSKDKQRLEAYINKFADQFQLQREYRFHPIRKWRFDWAMTEKRVAIEYEGGVFLGRGHTGGVIYGQNCEKYNTAALMGWTVLRFTAPMIRAGMHETMIREAIAGRRVGGGDEN